MILGYANSISLKIKTQIICKFSLIEIKSRDREIPDHGHCKSKISCAQILHLLLTQAQTCSSLLSSHGKSFVIDIFNSDSLSDLSVLL